MEQALQLKQYRETQIFHHDLKASMRVTRQLERSEISSSSFVKNSYSFLSVKSAKFDKNESSTYN